MTTVIDGGQDLDHTNNGSERVSLWNAQLVPWRASALRLLPCLGVILLLGCDPPQDGCASPTGPCDLDPQLAFLGPASPDDLAAQVQAADVLLSWTPLEAGMSVSVRRRAQSSGAFPAPFKEIALLANDVGAHTDAGVEPGAYEYRLRRCGASAEGSPPFGGTACTASNIVLVTVDGPSGRPSAPTDLSAEASADTVFLSWQNVTYAETIVVQSSANTGSSGWAPWQPLATLEGVAEHYEDTRAGPGMQRYRLRACNDRLCSMSPPYSNEAQVEVAVPPDAPSDLEATVEGLSVRLSWSRVYGATLIDVTRQPEGDPLVWLERLAPDAMSFDDEVPTRGAFVYQVHACNDYGCSVTETSVSVTGAPPSTYLSASMSTDGNAHSLPDVELSWSEVEDVEEWTLYRRYLGIPEAPVTSPSWEEVAVLTAETNEFRDVVLPGSYDYRLVGCTVYGCAESNTVGVLSWANPLVFGEPLRTELLPGRRAFYKVVIPESAHDPSQADAWAMIRTMSGTGDVTMYVRRDRPPTPSDFDCASQDQNGPGSNEEQCELSNEVGTWYVMLEAPASESSTYLLAVPVLTLSGGQIDDLAGTRDGKQWLHLSCELLNCASATFSRLYFQAEAVGQFANMRVSRGRPPTLWQYDCDSHLTVDQYNGSDIPARCELDFAAESYWIELDGRDADYAGVSFHWGGS